jgi:calcium permeable stress-gated cation channel
MDYMIHQLLVRDDQPATPTPSTPAEQFLALVSDPFKTQMQGQAFLSALGVSMGVTAIIAIIFCFIRPYNTVVYAPRLRHADEKHAPPVLGKSPWAWVSPVITTKEEMLVEKVGMDATVFIRFIAMCRNMFLALSVVGCGILIPVYVVGGKQQTKGQLISTFTKMTPSFLIGMSFWGIVVAAWIINITVCFFLWWNYRAVTRLRRHYFESQEYQSSLHSRTVMVTEVPKTMTTDEGLIRIVDEVKNSTALPKAAIGRNVKGLPDLIEEHEELVRQLESVLAKYLKNPDKLPPTRPLCKPSKKDPEYVKGQTQKVDAIDYLTRRIQYIEKEVKAVRASVNSRDAMPYGFASYESVEEAHSVAYIARNKHPRGASIKLAPRPSDIIWKNLSLSPKTRKTRRIISNLWVVLLTLIWIAPNALIAVFLSNLNNLGLVWRAFNTQLHNHQKFWAVVQGVAAPTLTSLVYIFLPKIFRRLAMHAGDTTKTSRDRHVLGRLFAFFVFNNLIVFSVFGAVWQFAAAIIAAKQQNQDVLEAIKNGNVWNKIMIALCNVAPFWASYLTFRCVSAALDLSQLANFAIGFFKRKFMSPTPRELIEFSAPPPFDYASYYNYFLFYSTVAIVFSTIQPVVLPVTALYFVLDAWLKKYLVMYVFTTKTESGGLYWRVLFNRMLFAIFLCDVVVALMVYAKHEGTGNSWIAMLGSLVPLPFLILGFKKFCSGAYDNQCKFYSKGVISSEVIIDDDSKSTRSHNTVSVRFGHPALFKPLMTPMVHAKAQHMLADIYRGRLDDLDDDNDYDALADTYSDSYNMRHIRNKSSRANLMAMSNMSKSKKSSPFEFVNESDLDFENFKNRDDFRTGDGDLYGRPPSVSPSRTGTPVQHGRAGSIPQHFSPPGSLPPSLDRRPLPVSRDSERTFVSNGSGGGYMSSNLRSYSQEHGGQDGAGSGLDVHLLAAAAPIGSRGVEDPISRTTTPGENRYRG